jgi:hypothetical protein
MTESHDPWEEARATQREEVKAIFSARASAPVTDRRREFRLSRRNSIIVLGVIAAVGLAAAIVVPSLRHSAADQRAADRRAQKRLIARETARIKAVQKPHFATGPSQRPGEGALAHRTRLLAAGRTAITGEARAEMRAGVITGPVAGAECRPTPDTPVRAAQEHDPAIARNRYECVAYERRFALSRLEGKARLGEIGVPYWLVIDYRTGKLAYCQLVPHAGEGGRTLATVPVARPCADPFTSSTRRP